MFYVVTVDTKGAYDLTPVNGNLEAAETSAKERIGDASIVATAVVRRICGFQKITKTEIIEHKD